MATFIDDDEEIVDNPSEVSVHHTVTRSTSSGETVETLELVAPSKVLERKPESACWNFFKFMGEKDVAPADLNRVICTLCYEKERDGKTVQNQMEFVYRSSTTNLNRHLERFHPKAYNDAKKSKENKDKDQTNGNLITNYTSSTKVNVVKWPKTSQNWKDVTQAIAEWSCIDSRPMSVSEDQGFRNVCNKLNPAFEPPCAKTVTSYVEKLYKTHKQIVMDLIQNIDYLSITTDGGSSVNAVNFIDINMHYVSSDWELKTVTLCVRENKMEHTAKKYREISDSVLREFGIDPDKVVLYVTDNEPKMRLCYPAIIRSGCTAHMIHSTVSVGTSSVVIIINIIIHIRRVAQKHNKSTKFRAAVSTEQEKAGVIVRPILQDVENRWNSLKVSTESLLNHPKESPEKDHYANFECINSALKSLGLKREELSSLLFTEQDMKVVENLNIFLTPIQQFSTTLGGRKFVTSSIVLPMEKTIQTHLKPSINDVSYISEMKKIMLPDIIQRVKENVNHEVLIKSTFLDPRFKRLKLIPSKDRQYVIDKIEQEMKALYDAKNRVNNNENLIEETAHANKKPKLFDYDESDDEETVPTVKFNPVKTELEMYLAESEIDKSSCPLSWWKVKEPSFPNVAVLAKKYFSVPATSVAAEERFSELGNLLNKRRLGMTGGHVDMQLFLKDKLRN